jgi:hypothetical protein
MALEIRMALACFRKLDDLVCYRLLDIVVAVSGPQASPMPTEMDILITAVRDGELDDQLAQEKKPPTAARSAKVGDKST